MSFAGDACTAVLPNGVQIFRVTTNLCRGRYLNMICVKRSWVCFFFSRFRHNLQIFPVQLMGCRRCHRSKKFCCKTKDQRHEMQQKHLSRGTQQTHSRCWQTLLPAFAAQFHCKHPIYLCSRFSLYIMLCTWSNTELPQSNFHGEISCFSWLCCSTAFGYPEQYGWQGSWGSQRVATRKSIFWKTGAFFSTISNLLLFFNFLTDLDFQSHFCVLSFAVKFIVEPLLFRFLICVSVRSVFQSVYLSVSLCLSLCLSLYLSLCLSVSLYLSVSVSVSLFLSFEALLYCRNFAQVPVFQMTLWRPQYRSVALQQLLPMIDLVLWQISLAITTTPDTRTKAHFGGGG